MSGLSGPSCLISNFSSNLNLLIVFLTETQHLFTGATLLAISASDIETTKDTGGIISVKTTTVLEYDHGADYFTTI